MCWNHTHIGLLGVQLKFSDEYPQSLHMGIFHSLDIMLLQDRLQGVAVHSVYWNLVSENTQIYRNNPEELITKKFDNAPPEYKSGIPWQKFCTSQLFLLKRGISEGCTLNTSCLSFSVRCHGSVWNSRRFN